MHPRVTALESALGSHGSLEDRVADFVRAGVPRIGVMASRIGPGGWAATLPMLEGSALDVTHLVHAPMFTLDEPARWDAERQALTATIDAAVAIGARCVYGTTGPALSLDWDDAAAAFCTAVEPMASYARQRAMPLLIEPTMLLYADMSIVHTLRDTVDLAQWAGIGVCVDMKPCWRERGLRDTIHGSSAQIGLVQVSDFIPGLRTLESQRAIPGDGVIPLERIVSWILGGGYAGFFDLELGYEPDVNFADRLARGSDHVGSMIDRLSAS